MDKYALFQLAVFLLAPWAVYRVASMLAREEGPGAIFEKFRNLYVKNDWIGRGLRCPACISFWSGIVMSGLLYFWGDVMIVQLGVVALGLSGVATFLTFQRL